MRSTSLLTAPALIGLALVSTGCMGRLVGEGAEKALGPKGAYWEEKSVASSKEIKALEAYKSIKLGEVKNDIGKNLPAEFITKFRAEFSEQLQASHLPKGTSGKTLVFNVNLIHYESADMTDNVLGPLEQVVAHVDVVDKESGKVLAFGTAIGRTGKTVGLGVEWKARGLAKALVKWVSDYYPKPKD